MTGFCFTPENQARAEAIIARYPPGRQASAVVPLLELAQRQQGGWVNGRALLKIAEMLDMPPLRVAEVASFYTMIYTEPMGQTVIQVCTTTPCCLVGSDDVMAACQAALGIQAGETTPDGQFSLREVECLGACTGGPVIQVNDDYVENMDPQKIRDLVTRLRKGDTPC